jgi:hypothetical protein
MQDVFWAWIIHDFGETILGEDAVVRYGIEEVGQAKSIVNSLQLFPVNIWSLDDVGDDTASIWLQNLGNSLHKRNLVVGVVKSLVREDKIKAAVLIRHVIEVMIIDTEFFDWNAFLKGLSTVVLVFSLSDVNTNDNIEFVDLDKLLSDRSGLSSTA